jgi:hypothetical protein
MKSKAKPLTTAEKAAKLAAIRELTKAAGMGQRPMGFGSMRPTGGKMASTGMRQSSSFRKPGV